MNLFSVRLKELRTERGLTQKQLAQKIGTTDDTIYSWEKGRSQPSIDMIRALTRELNTTADYLLGIDI